MAAPRHIIEYGRVALLLIPFIVAVSGADDPYLVSGLILAFLLLFKLRGRPICLAPLDIVVVLLWLYEAILLSTSINPISGFSYFNTLTVSVLYYAVLRVGIVSKSQIKTLLFGYSVIVSILAVIACVSFLIFEQRVRSGGFEDLYNFRFLHNSLGYLGNVWGSFLLGFVGILVVTGYHYRAERLRCILLGLMAIPVLLGVVRSFSRGVYIAFGFMLVALVVALCTAPGLSLRKKATGCITLFVTLFLLVLPYKGEVMQTLRMTDTVSQQRSIEGRVNAHHVAFEIIRDSPVVGVGSGNYSLAANEYVYEDDYTPFTALAYSIACQLPVEKGVIGLLLWGMLACLLAWMFIRGKSKAGDTHVIFITLVAISVREMTFPVLFEYAGLQLIVFVLLALNQGNCGGHWRTYVISGAKMKYLAWLPLGVCILLLPFNIMRIQDRKSNQNALKAVANHDFGLAKGFLDQVGSSIPYVINRSALQWMKFQQTGDTTSLKEAEQNLRRSISINPRDARLRCNLAKVLYAAHKPDTAIRIMNDLTERFPNNTLYHIVFFEMLHRSDSCSNKAIAHLIQAIKLSPEILDTPVWSRFSERDSAQCRLVMKRILHDSGINEGDSGKNNERTKKPMELARLGKILFNFGKIELAKEYLAESVNQLPNLSRPWCYLGIIYWNVGDYEQGKKYLQRSMTLSPMDDLPRVYFEKLTGEAPKSAISEPQVSSEFDFLYSKYHKKFRSWYAEQPLGFEVVDF